MADKIGLLELAQVTWGFSNYEHPVFSPDGTRIAYYGGAFGYLQLFVVGLDGHDPRPLTCAAGNHTQPSWSPDGRWIYYRHQPRADAPWAIWRVDVAAPEVKEQLLADPRYSFKHPSPSPNGEWLSWFSDQGSPRNFHLFKARLTGAGLEAPRQLTHDANRNDCHPTWSPDGQRLAFHAYMGAEEAWTSHIYVCDADGGKAQRISDVDAFHKHPFFVGRELLVHHTEEPDGKRFIALRRAKDGALVGRLTSGKKNDKHPSPFVPARGPVRICFASKKRGPESEAEREASYDVFWGKLTGIPVKR